MTEPRTTYLFRADHHSRGHRVDVLATFIATFQEMVESAGIECWCRVSPDVEFQMIDGSRHLKRAFSQNMIALANLNPENHAKFHADIAINDMRRASERAKALGGQSQ